MSEDRSTQRKTQQGKEPGAYSVGDTIRVPVKLKYALGIDCASALFRRLKPHASLGASLDPENRIELQGDGGKQTYATVELTAEVGSRHTPGEYLCVAIQIFDEDGYMETIPNPYPSKLFRIVEDGESVRERPQFLGWG